jgi:hypothetical protein
MDFEKGDLKPDELANLFPRIRLVVFNTYNHTRENPRFRVVIPFDQAISAADYAVLYDNIIEKIKDAGYSVGGYKGHRRSGLDRARKPQTVYFSFLVRRMIQLKASLKTTTMTNEKS